MGHYSAEMNTKEEVEQEFYDYMDAHRFFRNNLTWEPKPNDRIILASIKRMSILFHKQFNQSAYAQFRDKNMKVLKVKKIKGCYYVYLDSKERTKWFQACYFIKVANSKILKVTPG